MNVLSWSDVSFSGFDDCDESEEPEDFGPVRTNGIKKSAGGLRDAKGYERRSAQFESDNRDRVSSFSKGTDRRVNSIGLQQDQAYLRRPRQQQYDPSPSHTRERFGGFSGANERSLDAQQLRNMSYKQQSPLRSRDSAVGSSKRNELESRNNRNSTNGREDLRGLDDRGGSESLSNIGPTRNCAVRPEKNLDKGKPVRLSLQASADDPPIKVCPPLHRYTSVAELEVTDFFSHPWHSKL